MYNIGIRINHGTFRGAKLVTNHNFVSQKPRNIREKIFIVPWGCHGEVYQCTGRTKPVTCEDILLEASF